MNADVLCFFNEHAEALPLYERLESGILARVPGTEIRIAKTQISFFYRRMYACASFLPVRRAKDRPHPWLTVTFSLPEKVEDPRIDVATEPYPRRWTHHVMIGRPEEVDEQLLAWIAAAAAFAATKR